MRVGIFITARLGSTRLSQKHLILANGKMFIEWLAERFKSAFQSEIALGEVELFIVTSTQPENKKFEEIFGETGVKVFYGSDQNIPLRHLQCAEANHFDYILSVDGDDVLCSPEAAKKVWQVLVKNQTMAQTKGLPLGMNMSGYTFGFLKQAVEKATNTVLETGWGKIFDSDKIETISIPGFEDGEKLRMTLDYEDDATFFKEVIDKVGMDIITISDRSLIDIILKENLGELNENLNEEYWTNFNKQKQLEQ